MQQIQLPEEQEEALKPQGGREDSGVPTPQGALARLHLGCILHPTRQSTFLTKSDLAALGHGEAPGRGGVGGRSLPGWGGGYSWRVLFDHVNKDNLLENPLSVAASCAGICPALGSEDNEQGRT